MFKELHKKSVINGNEENYFRYNFSEVPNLSKLHLLLKFHESSCNMPGYSVV